jgi:hypothetical protein
MAEKNTSIISSEVAKWFGDLQSGLGYPEYEILEVPQGDYPVIHSGSTIAPECNTHIFSVEVWEFPAKGSRKVDKAADLRGDVRIGGQESRWETFLNTSITTPTAVTYWQSPIADPHTVGELGKRILFLFLPVEGRKTREQKEAESKRAYARGQFTWLQGQGFTARQARAIMDAAGPGQVCEAVEWVIDTLQEIISRGSEGEPIKPAAAYDALDMILCGLGGSTGFGRARTAAALEALGLEAPMHRNSRSLFRTLHGARKALRRLPIRLVLEEGVEV